ncbi:MAG: single-stranded DNA-binding protein [Bacteroidia bacterium]|nr:single-stranded DNA-binding protein [Bacteroidia bacterium]
MYQKIILIGYLGNDPDMRYTPNGQAVTNFSLATSRKWKGVSHQLMTETIWWRVSCWDDLAENMNKYLVKGQKVYVEGRLLAPKIFMGRSGEPAVSLEVKASTILMMSLGHTYSDSKNIPVSIENEENEEDKIDDEMPF